MTAFPEFASPADITSTRPALTDAARFTPTLDRDAPSLGPLSRSTGLSQEEVLEHESPLAPRQRSVSRPASTADRRPQRALSQRTAKRRRWSMPAK